MSDAELDDGGIDDFIKSSQGGGGGGKGYLKAWNKNISENPRKGSIDVWLHPRSKISKRWSHPFYRISTFRDKRELKMTRFNSMERGLVCEKQYHLDDEGNREAPPEICPFALTLEWVRQKVQAGEIDWLDEIFRIESPDEDPRKDVVIHAGGWIGLFDSKDVKDDKEKLRELAKKGIRIKEAFKEKGLAQQHWVLSIVDDDNAADGCKVATEARELGQKFGAEIDKRRKALDNPNWSPIDATSKDKKTVVKGEPTMFRWEHFGDRNIGHQYEVTAMTEADPSDEVLAAFEADPPDISSVIGQSNVAELQAGFEQFWCHAVIPPWKKIFEKAFERVKGTPAASLPGDFDPDKMGDAAGTSAGTSAAADDDSMVACDRCEKGMPSDAKICPHCGAEYDVDAEGNFKLKPEVPKVTAETPPRRLPRRQEQRENKK